MVAKFKGHSLVFSNAPSLGENIGGRSNENQLPRGAGRARPVVAGDREGGASHMSGWEDLCSPWCSLGCFSPSSLGSKPTPPPPTHQQRISTLHPYGSPATHCPRLHFHFRWEMCPSTFFRAVSGSMLYEFSHLSPSLSACLPLHPPLCSPPSPVSFPLPAAAQPLVSLAYTLGAHGTHIWEESPHMFATS